jgi:propionate CoA-transferase
LTKEGKFKKFIRKVEQITLNGKFEASKNKKLTRRAIIELTPEGPVLTEIAPGVNLEKDVLGPMEFLPIVAPNLKIISPEIFLPPLMGLKARFRGQ